ncbi:RNA-directed DNA polymerase from mobile element jockey [Labeo rohita]|uniref:RNA-directed DNA polymerase from mobile element jockey n=1 Tax=Labeo rohita TaxID=84645 RepID=A0ABQ8MSM6_LABRO|nr:RNA-directed DNA polymerase from mobile element jockey [Labeo rohita]
MNLLTPVHFSVAFDASEFLNLDDHVHIDVLTRLFDLTCTRTLDSVAPLKLRRPKAAGEPWLNDCTRSLRRKCRQAERKWRKDRLHVSLDILRDSLTDYQRAVKSAKSQYMCNLVSVNSHRPQVLFNVLNRLVNPIVTPAIAPSVTLCERFNSFFIDKISKIRSSCTAANTVTDPAVCNIYSVGFSHFEPVSLSELSKVTQALRPSECPHDSLPPKLLKSVFESVGPCILKLINSSLNSGCVPEVFKYAVVQPLLKKHNLDPSVLSNYRPISKLPFLSKVLEKVVFSQLQFYLDSNKITEKFQSDFKLCHSTETALLKIFNDLLLMADSGQAAVMVLLDLTAAFDTVDHEILLSRMEFCVRVKDTVLKWFRSYLAGRKFSVSFGPFSSAKAPLTCGVPQGSVLGPVLFSPYMLPLGSILRKYDISFHCFADDVQIYMPLKSENSSTQSLQSCLQEVKDWLKLNFLNLNESKTEIVMFGSSKQTLDLGVPFSSHEHQEDIKWKCPKGPSWCWKQSRCEFFCGVVKGPAFLQMDSKNQQNAVISGGRIG